MKRNNSSQYDAADVGTAVVRAGGQGPEVRITGEPSAKVDPYVRALADHKRALAGYHPTGEPRRDWVRGRLSLHRVMVIVYLLTSIGLLYLLQLTVWDQSVPARTWWEQLWQSGNLLWLVALPSVLPGLVGLLIFRHSDNLDAAVPIPHLVSFRIVSRGTNVEALTNTIRRCQAEMAATPLFPYVIEVVTDTRQLELAAPNHDVVHITVPESYQTANGTLYKARGLQYAVEHSELPEDAWIVHLDEETQPTRSGIKGIAQMISEEEQSGLLRVGQGAILYHRDWKAHPFLTLADNVRTGDDFARFHLQGRLGLTLFGLHGSYIVVRNDVEKRVGFDFGPVGSITEDAFWALRSMADGIRSRWCEGYLEEQSTQSAIDFMKQRRRWYQGLLKVALYAPVPLKWRATIMINTFLWTCTPFAVLYTVAHFLYGFETPDLVQFLGNLCFATYITIYLVGLRANLAEHGITNPLKRLGWHVAQLLLVPAFSVLEGLGILIALRTVAGFHVVKK